MNREVGSTCHCAYADVICRLGQKRPVGLCWDLMEKHEGICLFPHLFAFSNLDHPEKYISLCLTGVALATSPIFTLEKSMTFFSSKKCKWQLRGCIVLTWRMLEHATSNTRVFYWITDFVRLGDVS